MLDGVVKVLNPWWKRVGQALLCPALGGIPPEDECSPQGALARVPVADSDDAHYDSSDEQEGEDTSQLKKKRRLTDAEDGTQRVCGSAVVLKLGAVWPIGACPGRIRDDRLEQLELVL